MASLGELFIELGVVGDTKELDIALNTMKETVQAVDKQIQKTQRLIKYRQDLAKATDATEKKLIKSVFADEVKKDKLLAQKDALNKNIEANKNLANGIAGVVKGIGAFVTAIAGAAVAVNKLTNDLVKSNQVFLNLTRTSDIALSSFQKWNSIGKMYGVDNAAQQLEGLNQRLFELRLTGQGARGFQLAGINPTGDAENVLEQLRNRVSGMSDTSASYLLREMGLDPQMLHLLRIGREEFAALNKEMEKYRLTPEQSKSIQDMNVQLQIATQKLQYFRDKAVLKLMPVWVRIVKSFARVTEFLTKVIKKFKELSVVSHGVSVGIIYGLGHIKQVQMIFKGILSFCNGLVRKIPFLGKFFGKLGSFALKAILPLTLLYLLLDDLATYFDGGDSLIGRVLDWGKERGSEISDAFKKMFGGDFTGGLGDLGEISLQILEDILKVLDRIFTMLADFFTLGLWSKFKEANEWAEYISLSSLVQALKKLYKGMTGGAGGIESEQLGYVGSISLLDGKTRRSITNNDNRTASTNTSNVVNQIIHIQTEQPAEAVANEYVYAQRLFA